MKNDTIPFPPIGYLTVFYENMHFKLLISNGEKFVTVKELKETHPEFYDEFIKRLNIEDDKNAEEMYHRSILSYIEV